MPPESDFTGVINRTRITHNVLHETVPMTWKHLYRCLYMNFVALLIFIEVTYICGDSISGGTSRSELGALKLLYWATGGDRWRQGWDVQNEMSDPCIDRVRNIVPTLPIFLILMAY